MHVVVASDAQTRVSPNHSQEGVKKHDWQASVNQKNETQCVWRGSIDFLPAIFGHVSCEIGGMALAGGLI
jgi:hypothetical protein